MELLHRPDSVEISQANSYTKTSCFSAFASSCFWRLCRKRGCAPSLNLGHGQRPPDRAHGAKIERTESLFVGRSRVVRTKRCLKALRRGCRSTRRSRIFSPPGYSSGALPVGTQLPSEEELIREFKVSRTTIRATIQNLVRQGLVEIWRGRGTFVASPRIVQELTELTGFVEDMRVLGRISTARVLSREFVSAHPLVAEKLAVPAGTRVVQISYVFAFPTASRFLSTRLICRRTSAAGS